MRPARALAAVGFLLALLAVTPARAQTTRLTREQALAEITSPDVETRRRAAAWLGELGVASDAPPLLAALSDTDEVVRVLAEHSLWQVWGRSGDPDADSLLQIGIDQLNHGDGAAAVATFTKVIERKPDFAEAWNKRATAYFLMGENEKSLRDCDQVIRLNPSHFGALAGYGQIYLRLGQPERALSYFRRALHVNPNMASVRQAISDIEQLLRERRKGTI